MAALLKAAETGLSGASKDAGAVKDKLDKAAKGTKEVGKALEPVLKRAKDDAKALEGYLSRAKAPTAKVKSAVDAAKTKISQAQTLLDSGLAAAKAENGTSALRAFSDYYAAIKGPLQPLVESLPVLGAFLTGYGEAIQSASAMLADVEEKRDEHRKLGIELTGRDWYRFPSAKERELKKLRDEREKTMAELQAKGCSLEEDPVEAPAAEDSRAQISEDHCFRKHTSNDRYELDYLRSQDARHAAESRVDSSRKAFDTARKDLDHATARLATATAQAVKAKKAYDDAARTAAVGLKASGTVVHGFPPPADASGHRVCTTQYTVLGHASNRWVGDVCKAIAGVLGSAEAVGAADKELTRASSALEKAASEKQAARAALEKAAEDEQARETTFRNVQACLEKEKSAVDLNGIWHHQDDPQGTRPTLMVQRGNSFILYQGSTPGGEILLRGRVSGDEVTGVALFKWSASALKACGSLQPLWLPYKGKALFRATVIMGDMLENKTYEAESCKVKENASFSTQQLNYHRKR